VTETSQKIYQLSLLLLQNQQFAQARELLEKAVAAEPNEPVLAYPLAVAYAQTGDRERAIYILRIMEKANCLPSAGRELLNYLSNPSNKTPNNTCVGGGNVIEYVGPFATWQEARQNAIGYDAPNIIEKVLKATQAVIDGKAVFERDSVLFSHEDYNYQFLSSLFMVAAQTGGKLRVVDFGGSLGSSYWQNRKLLRKICKDISWRVVEQSTYLEAAQKLLYLEPLTFYPSIAEACQNGKPDVIVFSSVLQYIENFQDILTQAVGAKPEFVFIDRTPTLLQSVGGQNSGVLMVQNVSPAIYNASYPCRIFNPEVLPAALLTDYELLYYYKDTIDGTFSCAFADGQSITFDHRGLLLKHR